MKKDSTVKKVKKARKNPDSYDYLANSASANDCTGLIPSAPQSEAELQSYEEVYAYTAPKIKSQKDSDQS